MNPRFSKFLFYVFVAGVGVTPAYANPEGGVVSGGSATITSSGTQLTVTQSSHRAVIDWRSFDIAPNETTTFFQPSSSATVLNRVNSVDPSHILGTLKANGHVMIVNPNGVFFGAGSHVDVGSLTATTANIANEDFMAGRMNFSQPGNPNAKIVNEGHISVSDMGLVNLVAPEVENDGVISATLGKVTLASGDRFTLDLANDGLLQIAVSEETLAKQSVTNAGHIAANGGSVHLTAAAARDAVDSLITNTGVIEAKSLGTHKGSVTLAAKGANKTGKSGASAVVNSGKIDVSGAGAGEKGGDISLLGDIVWMESGASLNASGTLGGGKIMIGGDYHGEGDTQTARTTYVGSDIFIKADALETGNGGNVTVWADDSTNFFGDISIRGGEISGDGGFAEVSGKEYLNYRGHTNALAAHGETGLLLLDPTTLAIVNGSGDGASDGTTTFKGASTVGMVANGDALSTIYETELEGIASSVNVSLAASSAITIANLSDNNLNLAQVGGKSVTMTAGAGGITMADTNDTITTAGGSFTASATAGNITLGNITTNGGAVSVTTATSGTAAIGNVSAGGGLVTLNLVGTSSIGAISGTGTGVTKVTGAGVLTMSSASTYTGNTTLTNGTIIAGSDTAFGTGTLIFNGGTLQASAARTLANAVSLNTSTTGTISGTNNITFNGAMTNTYAGNPTLTVNSSGTTTFGSIALSNSANSRTVIIAGTGNTALSGVISNGGTATASILNKTNTGTMTISGTNTFAGGFTQGGGTTVMANNAAFGTGTLTLNGGNLQTDAARTITNAVSLAASTTLNGSSDITFSGQMTGTNTMSLTNSNSGAVTIGALDLSATATGRVITIMGNSNTTINGVVSNSGGSSASGLTKSGTGTLYLTNTGNTYTGTTSITQGLIDAGNDSVFSTSTISLAGGAIASSLARSFTNAVSITASSTFANATDITFTGQATQTAASAITNNGAGLLTFGNIDVTTSGAKILTIGGSGNTTVSGVVSNSGGSGSIAKSGTGTLSLNGNNTFNGTTTLAAGTIYAGSNNAFGTSIIALNGGTLNSDGGARNFASNQASLGGSTAITGMSSLSIGGKTTVAAASTLTSNTATNVTFADIDFGNGLTLAGSSIYASTGKLAMTASATLTHNGTSTLALNDIDLANSGVSRTLTLAGTGNITVSGTIANGSTATAGAIIRSNTGLLILNGNNSFGGGLNMSAGTLQVGHNNALGTGTFTMSGGVIQADNAARTLANAFALAGSITVGGTSDLTFSGKMTNTQAGNPTITLNNTGNTNFGDIDLASGSTNRAVVFAGAGNASVTGVIANGGTTGASVLTKSSSGSLTLSGNNNYGGTTSISAGTMTMSGNSTLGGITVSGGSLTISGSNTTTGTTSVTGGTLIIGNNNALGTGTLSLGGGTIQGDGTARTLGNAVTLAASSTVGGTSALTFTGAMNMTNSMTLTNSNAGLLTLGAVTVTSSSARNLTLAGNGDTTIAGVIANGSSGAAGIVKGGSGTLTINALNTYTGGTTINGGTLKYGTDNALNAGTVTIADGATYDLNDHSDNIGALTINSGATGGLVKTGTGTLGVTSITSTGGATNASITGKLSLGATARSITTTNAADGLTISAEISGTGGLTKAGLGSLTLTGNNIYSGTTSLPASVGTLIIGSNTALGTSTFSVGGSTLQGSGSARTLGNAITLGSAMTVEGTTAFTFTGAISGGSSRTITNNSSGLLTFGDITLSSNSTARTLTIAGTGDTTLSGTITNGSTSASGVAMSGSGTLKLLGTNSYTGATTANSGIILGAATNAAVGTVVINNGGTFKYDTDNVLGTGQITVNDGGTLDLNGHSDTIGALTVNGGTTGGLVKTGAGTLTMGGSLSSGGGSNAIINGNLDLGSSLRTTTITGSTDTLTINAKITGTGGISKAGNGTLALAGANEYTGATNVTTGKLSLSGGSALADDNLVTLSNTAGVVLELLGSERIGNLRTGGTNGGDVNLNANTLTLGDASNYTYSGIISGSGNIVKEGTGIWTVAGNNTYTGDTTINDGTLKLSAADRIADSSDIIVGANGTFDLGGFNETAASINASGAVAFGTTSAFTTSGGQTYSGVVTGNGVDLASTGGGAIIANNDANDLTGQLTISTTGNASVHDANSLSLGAVSAAKFAAFALNGDITLNDNVQVTDTSANAIILSAAGSSGKFLNLVGASVLTTGNGGFWKVYSKTPTTDNRNGLAPDFKQYNAVYGDTLLGTGDGFIHSIAPTITASLTGTVQKTYNGSLAATLADSNYSLSGAIDGDTVTLSNPASGSYDNANAGTGKIVSVSGVSIDEASNAGVDVYGYQLASGSISGAVGTIDKAALTVSTSNVSRAYDGTTAAAGTAMVTSGTLYSNASNSGTQDSLSGGTFAFDDANAGTNKTVSVSGVTVADGNGGNNYDVTLADNTHSTISKAALTISASDVTKTYDGTLAASGTATVTSGTLYNNASNGGAQDAISGGTFAFTNANAGANKVVTTTGVTVTDGNSGGNYDVTYANNTHSAIDKADITISASDVTKTYNGSLAASGAAIVTSGTLYSNASNSGTQDSISGGTFAFTDANAGTNKSVSAAGVTVADGNSGGNYNVTYANNTHSTINKAALTISTSDVTRTYNGSTAAAGTATVTSGTLYNNASNSGAQDSISGGTFAFDNANAGTNKTVSVTGVTVADGNSGNNYDVSYANNTHSTINKASLVITTSDVSRAYNGGTAAAGTATTSSTLYSNASNGGAQDTISGGTFAFTNANAGTNKTVTASGVTVSDGNGGGNYDVSYANNTHSMINQADLTISTSDVTKIYNGALAAAGTATVTSGTLYSNASNGGAQDSISGGSFAFTDANAGTNKTVTTTGVTVADGNSGGNYNITYANNTHSTIDKADLTVSTSNVSRAYDGTTAAAGAAIITSGTLYSNASNGGTQDSLTGGSFAFANAHAGTNKTVNVSGITVADGNSGGNYNVTQANNTTSSISKADISVGTSDVSRAYNGTTAAAGTAVLKTGTLYSNASNGGAQDSISGGTFAFDSANAGTNKTVATSGVTVADGNSGGNYNVAYVNNTHSTISQAALTITTGAVTKVYDGSLAASGTAAVSGGALYTNASNGNALDTISGGSFAFTNANAGTGKTVAVSGVAVNDGNSGGNYAISYANNISSVITAAPLTVSTSDITKVYDGTTAATGAAPSVTSGTLYHNASNGGALDSLTGGSFAFDTAAVGTGKHVSVSGVSILDGNSGGNYNLTLANNVNSSITGSAPVSAPPPPPPPAPVPVVVQPPVLPASAGLQQVVNTVTSGATVSYAPVAPTQDTGIARVTSVFYPVQSVSSVGTPSVLSTSSALMSAMSFDIPGWSSGPVGVPSTFGAPISGASSSGPSGVSRTSSSSAQENAALEPAAPLTMSDFEAAPDKSPSSNQNQADDCNGANGCKN